MASERETADKCAYRYPCNVDVDDPGPRCDKPRSEHPIVGKEWEPEIAAYEHREFIPEYDTCTYCKAQQLHPIHDPQWGRTHGFRAQKIREWPSSAHQESETP